MAWAEFTGRYDRVNNSGIIDFQRYLTNGEKVVIFEETRGLLRREPVVQKVVTILNDDSARIDIRRMGQTVANMGSFIEFGAAIENYEFPSDARGRRTTFEQKQVVRQDIYQQLEDDTYKGVLWLNARGERLKPVLMTPGRNYYMDDSLLDPTIPDFAARQLRKIFSGEKN